MEFGYLIKLSEGDVPEQGNVFKAGTYLHPAYGKVEITPERLQRFADNVNNRVRGIDLDIDYEHKNGAQGGKAAGWIRSAEVKDDKLFVNIEWTDPAKVALKNKEYRYLSADFADEWTDSDGKKHQDVLAGAALTNRPFVKDLMPLNFSEMALSNIAYQVNDDFYRWEETKWIKLSDIQLADMVMCQNCVKGSGKMAATGKMPDGSTCPDCNGSGKMPAGTYKMEEVKLDPKKLAEILGLGEETDETKLFAEATALKSFRDEHSADAEKAKKFAEDYPEQAKLLEESNRRMVELEKTNKLMETDTRLKEWSAGKNAVPPANHDKIRAFRMDLPADTAVKFDEIVAGIKESGLVDLDNEIGGGKDPSEKDAAKNFEDKIDQILLEEIKTNKDFTYAEAVTKAEREFPELAKAYVRG